MSDGRKVRCAFTRQNVVTLWVTSSLRRPPLPTVLVSQRVVSVVRHIMYLVGMGSEADVLMVLVMGTVC